MKRGSEVEVEVRYSVLALHSSMVLASLALNIRFEMNEKRWLRG